MRALRPAPSPRSAGSVCLPCRNTQASLRDSRRYRILPPRRFPRARRAAAARRARYRRDRIPPRCGVRRPLAQAPGASRSASRFLNGSSLRLEMRNDAIAVIALNLDDAVFCRAAAAAQALERLGRLGKLALGQSRDDRHDARTPAFAHYAHDTVIGNAVFHVRAFGRRLGAPRQTRAAWDNASAFSVERTPATA